MCVFRTEGYAKDPEKIAALGQTFSRDEGKTWTEPVAMDPACKCADPRVVALPDGTLVLSTGRPGLDQWVNADGTGKAWQHIDMMQHHNAFRPQERILRYDGRQGSQAAGRPTGYTEVVALDGSTLLYVYDRSPLSAHPNGKPFPEKATRDPAETYSAWVVQVQLRKR
jgi:hypothetical protein